MNRHRQGADVILAIASAVSTYFATGSHAYALAVLFGLMSLVHWQD